MQLITVAIIRDGEDILVLRRGPGDRFGGFWEFPGGPVEHPETLQECLERTLFSVLDVATQAGTVIAVCDHTSESGSMKLAALEATIVQGTITLSVHDKMRWLPASDIVGLKLAPAVVSIAQSLAEDA